jgi:hypothetical protein
MLGMLNQEVGESDKYSGLFCFLLIFLPISAKSCIFAAEIGVKTCR